MNGRTYLQDERVYRNKKRYEKEKRQREIRKKLFMVVFTFCLVVGLSLSYHALLSKANSASDIIQYKYYKSVSVASGDTLWTLAAANYENGYENIEDYICEVKEINHLNTDTIQTGQFLVLPYYSEEFK